MIIIVAIMNIIHVYYMEAPMDVAIVPSHTKCYAHTCTTSITLHTCKWKLIYTATVMYWCTNNEACDLLMLHVLYMYACVWQHTADVTAVQ